MSRRTRNRILILVAGIIALGGMAVVEEKIPPRAARLLPEGEAIVYANLRPLRLATHFDQKTVAHAPEYQQFIDATGFVFERDLDAVAFSLHRMADASGPNGPAAFSEVFAGRFDGNRLTRYLESVAASRESYAGHEIFTIPVGLRTGAASSVMQTGRMLRVVQLGTGMVGASNAPMPEQVHAMIDRDRSSLNPLSGPSLLAGLYPEVPLFSSVWGIGALGLPFAEGGRIAVFGLHLPLSDATPLVASLRYSLGLRLRVEQIAGSEADAARFTEKLTSLLTLVREIQQTQRIGRNDEPARAMLGSLRVEREGDRAIVTAEIPMDLVREITSAPSPAGLPSLAPAASK